MLLFKIYYVLFVFLLFSNTENLWENKIDSGYLSCIGDFLLNNEKSYSFFLRNPVQLKKWGNFMGNLTKGSIRLGEIVLFIVKLQLFWFVSVFRFGIITGIFPSTATVIDLLFKGFKELDDVSSIKWQDFLKAGQKHFKAANVLGFISFFISLILYIDWRISLIFIQNRFFHVALFLFTMVVITTLIYVLPCYVRYEMPLTSYFKQAFFLMLCSIPSSIAIFLGLIVVGFISTMFPVFTLVPVPLFLLPTAWFSYQSMLCLEKRAVSN